MIASADIVYTGGAAGALMEDAGMIGEQSAILTRGPEEQDGATGINRVNKNTGAEADPSTRQKNAKNSRSIQDSLLNNATRR